MNYVIIGNGAAGIQAAEAIRKIDTQGNITMIGDEFFVPYCRPMISMVLEGVIKPDNLPIRSPNFYDNLKIEPVLGKRATRIDTENKAVFIDNKVFYFDKLLISSGADPRPIKADGVNLKNIFFMRNQEHVRHMIDVLPSVKHALIIGGGLVGFKAAYGLLRHGIKVTMLIRSSYPLSMQVDEVAGKIIRDELLNHGLEVRLGVDVIAFEGKDAVSTAHLSDKSIVPCDMAVIGKGVIPALSFVPRDKIQADLGILVDEHMETGVSGIYAAGDVAESIDIARKTRWVNAIWPEAVVQGQIAGANMAGRPVTYKGSLSRNVIRIFGQDIMTAGIVNPPDDLQYHVYSVKNSHSNIYRKLIFREDILVGFVMVNNIDQGGLMVALIQNKIPVRISKESMLDVSFNYSKLIC